MKDQLRKIVREIMRETAISELELSKVEMDKLHSDGEVDVDGEKVTYDEYIKLKMRTALFENIPDHCSKLSSGLSIKTPNTKRE